MLNRNVPRIYTGRYAYLPNSGGGFDATRTDTVGRFYVDSGPIVRSNFKDENPWYYNVESSFCKYDEYYTNHDPYYGFSQIQTYISSTISPPPEALEVRDDALYKLDDKWAEMLRGSLDLSIDVLQSRQTLKMFNATDSLVQLFSRKRSVLKKAGSAWLQYVYGWKPLVSTIYGVVDNYYRRVNNGITKIEPRVHVRFDASRVVPFSGSSLGGCQVKFTGGCIAKYRLKYKLPNSDPARWTSLNPASIAWELLPYSFVIDWVYDVGSFLRNAETSILYNDYFIGGSKSVLLYQDHSGFGDAVRSDASSTTVHSYKVQSTYRSFQRTILTSNPSPRPPRLNVQLGASRLLSAASLLSQRLK